MNELPTRAQILEWIAQNPTLTAKRDIAKAFGIRGAERIALKQLLRTLEDEGLIGRHKGGYRDPETLPPVTILQVLPAAPGGDLFARPLEWQGTGPEPRVLMLTRPGEPALGPGDRILGRLSPVTDETHHYEARLIRRIGTNPIRILGLFRKGTEGGRILPVDKGADREWHVPATHMMGARDGELVEAEQAGPRSRMGLPLARIVERLGDPGAPRAVSLIAIHQHGIPDHFPDAAIAEADAIKPAPMGARVDLRHLPILTIDPADARDRDDAVLAQPDTDPENPGGHVLWVAIADVAHYVRPGSALDEAARERGNSTYFPDRVVPMLPDRLSGDLCSLHEGVPRAVLVCRMRLNAEGDKIGHTFQRAMIRSVASLSYEQVQAALDGAPDARTAPLLDPVLRPLHAAWQALARARARRQPLDLDLPERRIVLSPQGQVVSVAFKDRLDAHRLIEDCMVLANVAAAETLIASRVPLLFRVHEEPERDRIEALRETARASGLAMARGQVLRTAQLNQLLDQAAGTDLAELINMATLRAMTQAYYSPQNLGHFGLALRAYAHFTSPIRRYADLVVHRALIAAHDWGPGGLSETERASLDTTAQHISMTERRSMTAERDTNDRYLAAFLADRVGQEFGGRISGIARFGVFVRLDETGADGLVPMRGLGAEYFHFDREAQTLMGADTGRVFALGQRVRVRLAEAVPVTGGLLFELCELEGEAVPPEPAAAADRGRHARPRSGFARSGPKRPGSGKPGPGKPRIPRKGPREGHKVTRKRS